MRWIEQNSALQTIARNPNTYMTDTPSLREELSKHKILDPLTVVDLQNEIAFPGWFKKRILGEAVTCG